MKTAIITDSAANLLPEFIEKHHNLFVVPLMIVIDGVNYRDQVELSAEKAYEMIDDHNMSTSLPNIDDLRVVLEKIKSEGYTDILALNLSSGLSGTYNAFRLAFQDVKGLNITHYDTLTLGGGLGYIVEYALELVEAQMAPKDILPKLMKLRFEDSLAIYTINTLKYLRKGGRIGKVEGTIGNILHVKPVITVDDEGKYVTLHKGFGLNRALIAMKDLFVEKFHKDLIDLTVHYGVGKEKAIELANKLKKDFNIRKLTLSPLTPVLGIHTGPEMFSYVARRILPST
ncbi:DegV family protein [Mycoplasmatota bacterium]|nr:DegV family protein [Mycoplasmatota bacterium]